MGVNTYLMKTTMEDNQLHIGNFISISLDKVESFFNKGLKIIFIIIAMYFSIKIGKHLIKKFVGRKVLSNAKLSLDSQMAETLGTLLKSILKYSVYIVGISIIVSIIFGGIAFTFSEDNQLHIGKFISISLDQVESVFNKGLKVIFMIIAMYFSIKIGKHLIKKFVERQSLSNARLSLDSQRAETLGEVLKSILKYSVYFLGIPIIVSILFGGIGFTFASIGGIALGLGAQSLIKDLINGFFILFENQFGVGDHVTLGNFTGIVKSIGIRITEIKDFTGDIHSIPNGSIIGVTNHSRNDIRFIVDINISCEEDVENTMEVIKWACEEFKSKNEEYVNESIEIWGITELGIASVTIRVSGKAKPLTQWKMENELRKTIKLALDKNKIESPMKYELVNENIEESDDK